MSQGALNQPGMNFVVGGSGYCRDDRYGSGHRVRVNRNRIVSRRRSIQRVRFAIGFKPGTKSDHELHQHLSRHGYVSVNCQ